MIVYLWSSYDSHKQQLLCPIHYQPRGFIMNTHRVYYEVGTDWLFLPYLEQIKGFFIFPL